MPSAYFQPALRSGLASYFWLATHKVSTLYGSHVWVGKYLLAFDAVIVTDRGLPSFKQKLVVNWHPKRK